MSKDYLMLLASFESMIPLREPSGLSEPDTAQKLLTLSGGTIGELSTLLTSAAIEAVRSGGERIDTAALKAADWIPPVDRRRLAERLV